jgi:hypothetical protein
MALKNKSSWVNAMQKKMSALILEKAQTLLPQFQKIAKESVKDVEAVDSGLLLERTNAKVVSTPKAVIIQFITNNVEYAKYVYFGLGTNQKIGPRKYNLISAVKARDLVNSGTYERVFIKGGQNKQSKGDLTAGKKKNISLRRERIFKEKTGITQKKARKIGVYNGLNKAIKAQKKAKKTI